jgi:hypothetical protein
MLNWIDLVTAPRAKYIALCEGDDYWTDPLKLQKQVDFLEANEDFVACYHQVSVIDERGTLLRKKKKSFLHNRDLSKNDLINGMAIPTLSLCYRNIIHEYPPEFYKSPTGDNFLASLLGNHGKAKYLVDVQASAYRMHANGAWSLVDESKKGKILLLSFFWLWQYYERIGKPEYANIFYKKILIEGFYSDPFRDWGPVYLAKIELFIMKSTRRIFRLLRWFLRKRLN